MADNTPEHAPLAIIGIGCLFPKASGLNDYWSNIKNKVDGITEIPASHWSPEDYYDKNPKRPDHTYAKKGGFIPPVDFDPAEFGIAPNALEATDSAQLLGLLAAQMALRDAGYGMERNFDRSRVSVILGVTGTLELVVPLGARLGHPVWRRALKESGIGGERAEEIIERIQEGYVPWQESSFPGLLGNVVAGRIANRFNLGGTNCVVDAACASSLSAAHLAGLELQTRRSSMVVTGGVDCFNDIFMYMCFSKTPALSPSGDSRPFDAKADGTTLGEGLGMMVLKRLDDAEKDGDRIYAVLKGIGSSSDGRGKAIYAPSAEGQANALRAAYRNADVSPATIELVEAHGTGTTVGDGVELGALTEVYSEAGAKQCALGSVKSQIGHTKAAAGSAGLIKAILSLHHKVLPPTIKVTEPLKPLTQGGPFYLNTEMRPWLKRGHPRRAAVSALGFGGSNFHAVVEEYSPSKRQIDWDGQVEIAAFSGKDMEMLISALDGLAAAQDWNEVRVKSGLSRRDYKSSHTHRLCFVIEKGSKLSEACAQARMILLSDPSKLSASLPGWTYSTGEPGKLGVLFAGQGSQYVGMGRELFCQFPEAFDALSEADEAFGGSARLSDFIFPRSAFKTEDKSAQETALRDTSVAQPALGALGLAGWRVLSSFGVKPDALAGHSYGELAALCASGRLSSAGLHALSKRRGELMREGDGGRGGMLAVAAPFEDIERVLCEESLGLSIANKNAPTQTVLSGLKEDVARAAEAFAKRGMRTVTLPVSAAFHSPLVASAEGPFRSALNAVEWSASQIPVYADKTGLPYPAETTAARELLSSQLVSPVEFVALVENMYKAGVRTFLELGPGSRISSLAASILAGKPHAALALDGSSGKRSGAVDLARVLAGLAGLGLGVDLSSWQGGMEALKPLLEKKPSRMSVKLTGANYRSQIKPVTPPKAKKEHVANPAAVLPVPVPSALVPSLPSRGFSDNILALQRLQEQTAAIHLKFLEGQEAAQRSLLSLIEGNPLESAPRQEPPVTTAAAMPARPAVAFPASVPAAAPARTDGILPVLLSIVSEKTGYPAETIKADMDLESDLGIDSIKRVEILSAVQEKLPNSPVVKPEHLGTLRTLNKIAEFLSAGRPVSQAASTAPAQTKSDGDIVAVLLAIVSEKTGYPAETIKADMDLESDLGIDSIKRVEILSAVQEKLPSAPVVKPEHLGALRTLNQIAEFLSAGRPVAKVAAESPSTDGSDVVAVLLSIVSEKTGYPAETIKADMDLESDLGIDSIKRVEILSAVQEKLPSVPVVKPEHLGTLRTLNQIASYLSQGKASAAPSTQPGAVAAAPVVSVPAARLVRSVLKIQPLEPLSTSAPVRKPSGVLWVEGPDDLAQCLINNLKKKGFSAEKAPVELSNRPEKLGGLLLAAPVRPAEMGMWTEGSEEFLKRSFELAQAAGPALRAGQGVFLTVSRLDGAFGLQDARGQDPLSGGLAGLSKTAAKEWSEVSCKALDVSASLSPAEAAEAVISEMLFEGPGEVGLSARGRVGLKLASEGPAPVGNSLISAGDLVLITGGARGVTAETAMALAPLKPVLLLIGRSPEPQEEPEWLKACAGVAEIQRAIMSYSGDRSLSPKELSSRAQAVLAGREIRQNLDRLTAAGARVLYRAADVRDEAQLKGVLEPILREHGPLRAILHGAGVLADKLIADKTAEQFSAVFKTKIVGLRHLLAWAGSELKVLALFSSSTARFGRVGQVDYAMANEALNKIAQQQARLRPQCRVVSVNWGPWDGGMVTPALRTIFEKEGVDVIGLRDGANLLAGELVAGADEVELTVLATRRVLAPEVKMRKIFERALDVDSHPFLSDHVIGGAPVLPAAVIAEWLAQGAVHDNPGLNFIGFEGLRIFKGIRMDKNRPFVVEVSGAKAARQDGAFSADMEMRGEGSLRAGARILLGDRRPSAPTHAPEPATKAYPHDADSAYRQYLFHGKMFQGIRSVEGISQNAILLNVNGAGAPTDWMKNPRRSGWLMDPLILDCAFQGMILWSFERAGAGCLPHFVGSYRQYVERLPAAGVRAVIRIEDWSPSMARANVEFLAMDGSLVAVMNGLECTIEASLKSAFTQTVKA